MSRKLRLLDHVYYNRDPYKKEGIIIFAEEDDRGIIRYVIFFACNSMQQKFYEDELILCNTSKSFVFLPNFLSKFSYSAKELSDDEIQSILNNKLSNPSLRRKLWYDIIFYKPSLIPHHINADEDLPQTINPIILRLLQFPIPDEIRCFYWAIALDIGSHYNSGYFSSLQNKLHLIPDNSMKMIKDDLRRPEKGYPSMSDRVEKVLTALYINDHLTGYVQGMDRIIHFLLLLFSEEEAFYVFIGLKHFLPTRYFVDGTYHHYSSVVMKLLEETNRYYKEDIDFQDKGLIIYSDFVKRWMTCLFSSMISPSLGIPLLDLVISLGAMYCIPVASAIVFYHEDLIKETKDELISEILHDLLLTYDLQSIPSFVCYVYELCLRSNLHQIRQWYEEFSKGKDGLRNEQQIAQCDEQNGIIGDMQVDSNYSSKYTRNRQNIPPLGKSTNGLNEEADGNSLKNSRLSMESCSCEMPFSMPSFSDYEGVNEEANSYEDDRWRTSQMRTSMSSKYYSEEEYYAENGYETVAEKEEECENRAEDDRISFSSTSTANTLQIQKQKKAAGITDKKSTAFGLQSNPSQSVGMEKDTAKDGQFFVEKEIVYNRNYLSSFH